MDDIDRQLLSFLESGFGLVKNPFAKIRRQCGIDTAEVLLRLHCLRDEKIFTRISALFDLRKLGYRKVLALFSIPPGSVEASLELIHRHPAFLKSFSFAHEWNVGVVLFLPVSADLKIYFAALANVCEAVRWVVLEKTSSLKADSAHHLGDEAFVQRLSSPKAVSESLTDLQVKVVRALSGDIPLAEDPFRKLAQAAGADPDLFLTAAQELEAKKILRRIKGFVHPEKRAAKTAAVDYAVFWNVPAEKVVGAAAKLMRISQVLDCSIRRSGSGFPFNLMAWLKAGGGPFEEFAIAAAREIGNWSFLCLRVEREFSVSSVRYFPEDLSRWEEARSIPVLQRGEPVVRTEGFVLSEN